MARKGWKNVAFVVLQRGYPDGIPINKNTAEALGKPFVDAYGAWK